MKIQLLVCYVEELASSLVFMTMLNAFGDLSIFQTEESGVALFLFSSSCIIGENDTSGMSFSC